MTGGEKSSEKKAKSSPYSCYFFSRCLKGRSEGGGKTALVKRLREWTQVV